MKNSTSHEIPTMKPLDMEKKAEKTVEAPAAAPAAEEDPFDSIFKIFNTK